VWEEFQIVVNKFEPCRSWENSSECMFLTHCTFTHILNYLPVINALMLLVPNHDKHMGFEAITVHRSNGVKSPRYQGTLANTKKPRNEGISA